MKNTSLLKILADSSFPVGKVVIHPNDGADLNLFQLNYPVKIYHSINLNQFKEASGFNSGVEFLPGDLTLSNNCKPGTVELPQKLCMLLKSPKNAVLVYDEGRLLLAVK